MEKPLPFPFEAERLFCPPGRFRELRGSCPVAPVQFPTGDRGWLVTRYEDVKTVLTDHRFSRAAAALPDAPRMRPMPAEASTILSTDPPDHTRLRKLVVRAFSARRVDAVAPRIEQITSGLLDAMATAGPPADLVSGLALPLPITVIADLLGVPAADRESFRADADIMLSLQDRSRGEIAAARQRMNSYLAGVVAAAASGDDLISTLARTRDEEKLTEQELVTMAATLLIAGYHTTSTAISTGVLNLLRHPGPAAAAARPGTIEGTVEELLRYGANAVNGGNLRVATEDVTLGGALIRAGDAVLPSIVSANQDADVFADPGEFDPGRTDNPHMAFGAGPHYCLGARLARLEMTVAIRELFAWFPGLRLGCPEAELRATGSVIRGLERLPVSW